MQILSKINTRETLSRYFPVEAVDHISQLMTDYRIRLKVNKGRATRLGDFKPAMNGDLNQISVNGDLNIYAFQLVFIHELAHLKVYQEYPEKSMYFRSPGRLLPHGKEWKKVYGDLIRLFVGKGYFHPLLHEPLMQYSSRVRASGIASEQVVRVLRLFDGEGEKDRFILLEELPEQEVFFSRSGRQFKKGALLRKRYRCLCLDNQRTYLFHPMASVRPGRSMTAAGTLGGNPVHAGLQKR